MAREGEEDIVKVGSMYCNSCGVTPLVVEPVEHFPQRLGTPVGGHLQRQRLGTKYRLSQDTGSSVKPFDAVKLQEDVATGNADACCSIGNDACAKGLAWERQWNGMRAACDRGRNPVVWGDAWMRKQSTRAWPPRRISPRIESQPSGVSTMTEQRFVVCPQGRSYRCRIC